MLEQEEIEVLEFENLRTKLDVLIVVATDIEINTVQKYLTGFEDDTEYQMIYKGNNTFYIGKFGLYSTVVVKTNNMGTASRGASL